jgi:predicted RNase H-like HicB family nuclease
MHGSSNVSKQESPMKYRVLIEQDEDGFFVAEVPALPGCVSQGATREEALPNIREAWESYHSETEGASSPPSDRSGPQGTE